MDASQLFLLLCSVLFTVSTVKSCMVTYPWKPLTLEQTVSAADIVVFGQETEHIHSSKWSWGTDAVFHVYCVIKKDGGPAIPERIIVEGVRPIHSCMGTFTRQGEVMMLALKRTKSGNFRWHEVGIMQTAKFQPTQDNLQRALRVVGEEAVMTPEGRNPLEHPSCPHLPNQNQDEEEKEETFVVQTKGLRRKQEELEKKWPKKEQAVASKAMWRSSEKGNLSREEEGSGEFQIIL